MMIGMTITGIGQRTKAVIFTLVHSINPIPPTKIRTLRKATETELPITDRINVVSVVIRLRTSPVMIFS